MADVPVSRQTSIQIQLEVTIQSAYALLKAGLVEMTDIQSRIKRALTMLTERSSVVP